MSARKFLPCFVFFSKTCNAIAKLQRALLITRASVMLTILCFFLFLFDVWTYTQTHKHEMEHEIETKLIERRKMFVFFVQVNCVCLEILFQLHSIEDRERERKKTELVPFFQFGIKQNLLILNVQPETKGTFLGQSVQQIKMVRLFLPNFKFGV